jgi:hypothetical protein
MMTMAHAAAGAAIAHALPQTGAGLAAAFAAHALLDLPRHTDLDQRREILLTTATIGLALALFGVRRREFWGSFLCACPDLEHLLRPRARKLYPTHRWPRLHGAIPTPNIGAATQVVLGVATLLAVARRTREER